MPREEYKIVQSMVAAQFDTILDSYCGCLGRGIPIGAHPGDLDLVLGRSTSDHRLCLHEIDQGVGSGLVGDHCRTYLDSVLSSCPADRRASHSWDPGREEKSQDTVFEPSCTEG